MADPPHASPPASREAGLTSKVADLVAAMTLDEKLPFVHGATDPGRPRQSRLPPRRAGPAVPELRLADGPAGIHLNGQATALPAPIGLGSTFDDRLGKEFGATREAVGGGRTWARIDAASSIVIFGRARRDTRLGRSR